MNHTDCLSIFYIKSVFYYDCRYIFFRDLPKAAEAAIQERNLDYLEEVQSKALRNPELVEHIRLLKTKLGYK